MFDFEKLNVYHKAKLFHKKMHEYLLQHSVDQVAKQQFMSWVLSEEEISVQITSQFKHYLTSSLTLELTLNHWLLLKTKTKNMFDFYKLNVFHNAK